MLVSVIVVCVVVVLILWLRGCSSAAEFLLTPGFQLLAQTDR